MEEIYRNRVLNYGYISSLSLLALIFIYNILTGSFNKFTENVNLSQFSIKFVLILVVIVTYISLTTPSFRILNEKKIFKKTPPRGDIGIRGERGGIGEGAACKECGDELCFKKMMFNITKTINFWKQKNGMDLLDENYIIENEYIKDKVKKHCKSKQFKKLITKYGSNNKDLRFSSQDIQQIQARTTTNNDDIEFGAYDYMFKMWSIWILIILRYKNGMFFLDSYGLKEADFDGLIEREDGFNNGTSVTKSDDTALSKTQYQIVDKMEFPFYKIKDSSNNVTQEYINNLDPVIQNGWDNMFNSIGSDTDTNTKESIVKLKKIKKNSSTEEYEFEGINDTFITEIGNVPSGGKLNPFHEIKKYSSWFWGADPAGKPRFTINREPENLICRDCQNSTLCNPRYGTGSIGIKIKYTNSYSTLVDLSEFGSSGTNTITPFKNFTTDIANSGFEFIDPLIENSTLFRPQMLTDDSESHPLFRNYKPVGDVLIKNANYKRSNDASEASNCRPSDMSYEGEIFEPIIGREDKDKPSIPQGNIPSNYTAHDHIYTLLVSGDTKPPASYELVAKYNKSTGINKNMEGISIWKPIPENGYTALGYVVDMRPFKESGNPPQPPRDLIATVPSASLSELSLGIQNNLTNINTIMDIEQSILNSPSNSLRDSEDNPLNFICSPDNSINTGKEVNYNTTNAQFKSKKYSIQKIFDNNNE